MEDSVVTEGEKRCVSFEMKEDVEEEDGELLVKIHGELINMGQALKCPLCLHTLRGVPVLTSCGHAFCRECLSDCCHHSNQWWCPVCKHGMASKKRGWVSSPHLESLVQAYKLGLRAFGMTPIVYTEGLCMTQMPDNSTSDDPSLQQCHEHLEVSRTIHKALQQRLPKEHLNHERKKIQTLLHDQQRVIQEDERALVRAAVAKKRQTQNTTSTTNNDSTLLLHDGNTILHKSNNDNTNDDSTLIIHDGNTLLLHDSNNNDEDTTILDDTREQEAADQLLEPTIHHHEILATEQQQDSSQPIFLSALEQQGPSKETLDTNKITNQNTTSTNSRDDHSNTANREDQNEKENVTPDHVTPQHKERFSVGAIVRVQSRTWSGINKPGGVGRVTKVIPSSNHPSVCTYNIKYVLGGSEKQVDAVFVQLEPTFDNSSASNSDKSISPRRQKRQRSSTSILSPPPTKKNKHKKKKPCPKTETSITTIQPSQTTSKRTESYPLKSKKQPNIDIYREASQRYKSLLTKSTKDNVLYIVTSSLNDYEQNMFNIFVSELKSWKDCIYTLKVTNDLVIDKTVLCVTSANKIQNVVTSRLRTLKVMRATLAGIPIVTTAWITECLQKRNIILPPPSFSRDDPMFISTLPSKMQLPKEKLGASFGVWSLAASYNQEKPSLLLEECHVYLCGAWKKNAKKDVQLLLRQTGAEILPNASATVEILSILQEKLTTTRTLILLCHESSTTDKQSGITQQISKSIQKLALTKSQIMVVNSNCLFHFQLDSFVFYCLNKI